MLRSEKRSLGLFLALYAFFSILVLSLLATLYLNFEKNLMLQEKRLFLSELSNDLIAKLKHLHINFDKQRTYPRDPRFNSAIYDSDRVLIFSTLKSPSADLGSVIYRQGDKIHYVKELESYYLGAKFVILEIQDDKVWLQKSIRNILTYGTGIFTAMIFVGFFLMKLFLRPMRNAIMLLDRFIKDTTHELGTPVGAIMANIETIDKERLDPKTAKKITRIEIGARSIFNLYQDLAYLALHHKTASSNEPIDLARLLQERIEYFRIMAESKKISIKSILPPGIFLVIDRHKITRLIDNILSNAIKYNKIGGTIAVTLEPNAIGIEDSGIGIKKEHIDQIYERYARFEPSVGGFGIGLNIAALIAKEYNLKIHVDSQEGVGTKVKITW